MREIRLTVFCVCLFLSAAACGSESLMRVADGFAQPLFATHAPSDNGRLFVLEKNTGLVKIVDLQNNSVRAQPFLQVTDLSTNGERGLLGMAFHPQYQSNRQIFISATNVAGASELRRYSGTSNADLADSSTYEVLITIAQPASNHNGGWIGFGPDGYLYMSSGDGGGGNDPQQNGQDLTTLLGGVLRLDIDGDDFINDSSRNYRIPSDNPFIGVEVDGESARPELWAYGLRNPWRASFDRQTGDLWIADVGQAAREEVNFQSVASQGGNNYGWRLREGSIANPTTGVGGAKPNGNTDPIYDYIRGFGPFQGFSVTGGYRYRGPVLALRGAYFFGDFVSGQIWSIEPGGEPSGEPSGDGFKNRIDWTPLLQTDAGEVDNIASFGEDNRGNLYLVDFDGEIYKFVGDEARAEMIVPAINLILDEEPE